MSPIPSLPTDNLYKFCAVAGSLAVLVSVLVMFQAWRDLVTQEASLRNRGAEYEYQKSFIKMADMFSKPWWQPDGGDTPEAAAKTKEMQDEAKRLQPAIDKEGEKLAADWSKFDLAKYDLSVVALPAAVGVLVGLALGGYGFRNWRKLQLKQDQLLDLELKERRAGARSKQ